jgi:DNA-binding beta-propeller fold protein YncE
VKVLDSGMAVSRDGSTLLVADAFGGSHSLHEYSVADDCQRRVVGVMGTGPLQFIQPRQVCIAADDHVFVADADNARVQVLTPTLEFHSFVGVGQLTDPIGVCANADVVAVSEVPAAFISVFSRRDGALLCRFGGHGSGDGQLACPSGLCFMSSNRHIAVAEYDNSRVSVFGVGGGFIRHVGVGVLGSPRGAACSAFDERVVAPR